MFGQIVRTLTQFVDIARQNIDNILLSNKKEYLVPSSNFLNEKFVTPFVKARKARYVLTNLTNSSQVINVAESTSKIIVNLSNK